MAEIELSDEQIEQIAKRVAELVSSDKLREVVWEVVPDMAEVVIRERLEELEAEIQEL